ncbi:MAG: FKBP-type peptidyl-prolyl cis-trans isomerase [Terracidiphilus sp.]|nr:FKBP-type peptidyl-prolyl cis-trans isomerase [Terracidiphilus sp.]
MKRTVLILLMAACAAAASAQTPAKPASPAAKTAATAAKTAATAAKTAKPSASVARPAGAAAGVKLPAGVPAVRGIVKTAFAMRYEDIKIGTGAAAEPNKLYKVHYTGWLAADGRKFDSSYDHPRPPVVDKDGKPVLDADGKPKLGEAQPIVFPQGYRKVIAGWEVGFEGMKVGGKRRLFIPYQLAYGELGHPSSDPKNPGIPAKADMIFDVELVDVMDMQMPTNHPGMGGMNGMGGMPAGHTIHAMPASPDQSGTAAKPAAAAAPATPAQPK